MIQIRSFFYTLLLLLSVQPLSGCATTSGPWPNLRSPAQAAPSESAVPTPPAPPALSPVTAALEAPRARLRETALELARLAERLKREEQAVRQAQQASGSTTAGSAPWATRQRALTRYSQAIARHDGLRHSVLEILGDLASIGAEGADVSAPVREAGALLIRIRQSQDAAQKQRAALGS